MSKKTVQKKTHSSENYKMPREKLWGKIVLWLILLGMIGGVFISFIVGCIEKLMTPIFEMYRRTQANGRSYFKSEIGELGQVASWQDRTFPKRSQRINKLLLGEKHACEGQLCGMRKALLA